MRFRNSFNPSIFSIHKIKQLSTNVLPICFQIAAKFISKYFRRFFIDFSIHAIPRLRRNILWGQLSILSAVFIDQVFSDSGKHKWFLYSRSQHIYCLIRLIINIRVRRRNILPPESKMIVGTKCSDCMEHWITHNLYGIS